jgi:predicted unusual protein kinase regulating ubiquinone biosynthesis (AarF/ABC1/UbiB family)
MPFQVPQDLIYLGRAVGILSGMCTALDPEFNPWTALAPYAQRLAERELRLNAGTVLDQLRRLGRQVLELPQLAEGVFRRAERGELQVRTTPDPESQRQQRRLQAAINQLAIGLVSASLVIAGTILVVNDERALGFAGYALAGVSLLAMLWRGARR